METPAGEEIIPAQAREAKPPLEIMENVLDLRAVNVASCFFLPDPKPPPRCPLWIHSIKK
jgi:hypothetical protein